jgi:hypothetical protein
MRFARTSALSLLTVGFAWSLAWGCGNKDPGSTFATGSGTQTGTNSGPGPGAGGGIGTNSGTNTTTGINPPVGAGGQGGSGVVNPDANCGAIRQGTKQIPVDVFVMQDKSGSMDCPASDDACQNPAMPLMHPTRWEAMGTALGTFVDSPAPAMAGVAIGIGFFPGGGGGCNAATYANPTVAIAPLPANATPIKNAIAANMPNGGTPTTPALTGAIQYARQYTMDQMGQRTAAVLLVTDGVPTGCTPNTPATAAMVAMNAYNGTPQIKTFVVGMGDTAALDQIALAGSGGMQHYIPTMGDVVTTLTNALSSITGMITCNYARPAGSNPNLVNVQITVAGGMQMNIGKVDNAAACPAAGGWYYDNNTTPTMIILCPTTCDAVKNTPNSGVEVLYGCPSNPPA